MASIALATSVGSKFVPKYRLPSADDVSNLQKFVDRFSRILVVTGAGISTESGIPDYRSEGVGLYARSTSRPVQFGDFLKSQRVRQRYWARNFIGWEKFSSVKPNSNHRLLKNWEDSGKLFWLVTQNVDALHRKAGSSRFTELHGCLHEFQCLKCGDIGSRAELQEILKAQHPNFTPETLGLSPDGDVQIPDEYADEFQAPLCQKCGGDLKTRVVFFGDNVPKSTVAEVRERVSECDSLLAIGTSLQTYSSYRIALQAAEEGKDIGIINIGSTRADHLAKLKVHSISSETLKQINVQPR